MRKDKLLSFYNLQDEKELEYLLDGVDDLEYEKISAGNGEDAAVYRLSIGEGVNIVKLMNIFMIIMKKNDKARFKFSKIKKFIIYQ